MKHRNITRKLPIVFILFALLACKDKTEKSEATQTHTVSSEIKSIFINGDSIHYIDTGKGETVVFVHGTLGDYRTWGAQLDTFSKNYRVIVYSRRYAYPNRQVINDSADYTITPHSNDLAELIKSLNLGPVHLVGHSFGAYTALLTTLNHPELVKTVTLGEPPVFNLLMTVPGGDTIAKSFFTVAQPAADAFKSGNDEKGVSLFVGWVIGDSNYLSKAPPEVRAIMLANTLELRGSMLSGKQFQPVSCDDLKKINTPVLLLYGERTTPFFSVIINEMEKCIKNKEKAMLPNATHGLEFDNPSEFNRIVLGFIDKY